MDSCVLYRDMYFSLFFLRCLPGFSGKFCEININESSSSPCLNGVNCEDHINGYICKCQQGNYEKVMIMQMSHLFTKDMYLYMCIVYVCICTILTINSLIMLLTINQVLSDDYT